jgi:ABC-type xylose transport system substrate-binding protein
MRKKPLPSIKGRGIRGWLKLGLTGLILSALTVSLANCAINSSPAGAEAKELRIGLVFPTSFMNYILDKTIADWNYTQERLIHYLTAAGVERDHIFTESAADADGQMAAIDKLVDQQVDWIVISGLGDERLSSFMGIPLPFLDYRVSEADSTASQAGSDSVSGGETDLTTSGTDVPIDQTTSLMAVFARAQAANVKIGVWGNGPEIDQLQFQVVLPDGFAIGQFQAQQLLSALENSRTASASASSSAASPSVSTSASASGSASAGASGSASASSGTGSAPWAVEILANTSQGLFTDTYLDGVCSVLRPKFLDGTLTSRLADCQTEPIVNWTAVDQTDLLNFGNQVKSALNPYLPNLFGVESIQLAAVLASTDQIAKEVAAVFEDASLIPNPQFTMPLIFGVGAMKLSIQNMVDSKQYSSVIYDNDQLAQTVASTIVNFTAAETEQTIAAQLVEITLDNLKTQLIDTGYLSPGEAGL